MNTLLTMGLWSRLLVSLGLIVLIWLAVFWAMG